MDKDFEKEENGEAGQQPEQLRDFYENKDFVLQIPQDELDADANYLKEGAGGAHASHGPQKAGHAPQGVRLTPTAATADQMEKQAQKEHKRRNRIKSKKNRHVFSLMWVLMVILLSLTLGNYLVVGANDFLGVNRAKNTAKVSVPQQVTIDQLAQILYDDGVINSKDFFSLYCDFTTDVSLFREGVFEVDTTLDYEGIINLLQTEAEKESVSVTFREGQNMLEIADLLEENGVCTAQEILEYANSDEFTNYWIVSSLSGVEGTYYKLEGYLFPDKYDFYLGEDPKSVIGKMLNNFQHKMTEQLQEQINQSGMSMNEVITLASIIQAEAANEKDMYMVSAILHNRLDNGRAVGIPTLGLDSTKYYPYRTKEAVPEDIRDTYISNYDTYSNAGLPAGPICCPGIEAITAALSPSEEGAGYYYFGHGSDGTAYYARTYEEHLQNQLNWG